MNQINIIALFCEDIREEANGQITLVGILPDNVNAMNYPGQPAAVSNIGAAGAHALSKLAIYLRINFHLDFEMQEAMVLVTLPTGSAQPLGMIDGATVTKAREEAKERGNLMAGVLLKAIMPHFQLPPHSGALRIDVVIGEQTYLAGAVTFKIPTSPSSESAPPSLQ